MRPATLAVLLLAALLIACGAPGGSTQSSSAAASTAATTDGDPRPVLATSEIVVGPNRVALGLLEQNVPIKDAAATEVAVSYFRLEGETATPLGQEQARFYGEGLGDRGTFVIHPTFDRAGAYGLELAIQRPGREPVTRRISLEVTDKGSAPALGSPAPRSVTPTAADVADLHLISSASEPDPRLHAYSIDKAVTSGKPSLILFATPGYCQTQVCGPGVDVLGRLADRFGDAVVPVHVEVYKLPYENGLMVPAMREWGLQTEPWLFLVDRDGAIAGRFEGGITYEELEPEVAKLVAQ